MSEEHDLAGRFVRLLDARDWEQWAALLHPDVVYEMPQTRERIVGRERYVRFNQEYPGGWRLEPRVVVGGDGNAAVMLQCTVDGGEPVDAIVFLEVVDGRVVKVTDFWPEPYEPPTGREHLTERF